MALSKGEKVGIGVGVLGVGGLALVLKYRPSWLGLESATEAKATEAKVETEVSKAEGAHPAKAHHGGHGHRHPIRGLAGAAPAVRGGEAPSPAPSAAEPPGTVPPSPGAPAPAPGAPSPIAGLPPAALTAAQQVVSKLLPAASGAPGGSDAVSQLLGAAGSAASTIPGFGGGGGNAPGGAGANPIGTATNAIGGIAGALEGMGGGG